MSSRMNRVVVLLVIMFTKTSFANTPTEQELLEFLQNQALAEQEKQANDGFITPAEFDRYWNSANKNRLFALQIARLNPYSPKYLIKNFALYANTSMDRFDIKTVDDGEERAEISGSQIWWYGENFFVDSGRLSLKYKIEVDFQEQEKDIAYGRSLLGYRFSPYTGVKLSFGASIDTKPKIINGEFSSEETDREVNPFFTFSALGLHYSRDQRSQGEVAEFTSYAYERNGLSTDLSWMQYNGGTLNLKDEFEAQLAYEWQSDSSFTNLAFKRSELTNTQDQNWSLALGINRFNLYYIVFDEKNELRQSKTGYGLSVGITDWLATNTKGRKVKSAHLLRDIGIIVGVHKNNIQKHVLTAADEVVWSLVMQIPYGSDS